MQDISVALDRIMQNRKCSSVCAFFLLCEKQKDGDTNGLRKLQSKSKTKTGRRLRDTGNF